MNSCDEQLLCDVDNLNVLDSSSILDLLKRRYAADLIYTWASKTLIAINPYKTLSDLYSVQTQKLIYGGKNGVVPHVYSIGEEAVLMVKHSLGEKVDTSIIISGESGSGKTESTKHLLRYLTVIKCNSAKSQNCAKHVETHILACSPILEAFGNAKTPNNDNSSRFGKYIALQYDSNMSVVGSYMQTYLLEKTRVVKQSQGCSNFHIFYQFVNGISEQERKMYLLTKGAEYAYLPREHTSVLENGWLNTMNAWCDIGLSKSEKNDMCKVLSGILNLGNVEITCHGEDAIEIADRSSTFLSQACQLLSINQAQLRTSILSREISTVQARRKSIFYKPCTQHEALARRDCIAKLLYSSMFSWLVNHMNSSLRSPRDHLFIGLLDIYGFEIFDTNCLEQLCINYANERIQYYYMLYYLKQVQYEYEQEGITWSHVSVTDNEDCVSLLAGSPSIFSLLNEECLLNRIACNGNIAEKLYVSDLVSHPRLIHTQKSVNRSQFTVNHYASQVTYSTTELVDKNRDNLPQDIISVLSTSRSEFIQKLVSGCQLSPNSKPQKKTVLSRFKQSLDDLISLLRSTECLYIRCIKPNRMSRDGMFDSSYIDRQLEACGVMETVKIRTQAHAVRIKYGQFLRKYEVLQWLLPIRNVDKENSFDTVSQPQTAKEPSILSKAVLVECNRQTDVLNDGSLTNTKKLISDNDQSERTRDILKAFVIFEDENEVQFGRTCLFIKSPNCMLMLNLAKKNLLKSSARKILSYWRLYKQRIEDDRNHHAALVITRFFRLNCSWRQFRRCKAELMERRRQEEIQRALDRNVTKRKRSTLTSSSSAPSPHSCDQFTIDKENGTNSAASGDTVAHNMPTHSIFREIKWGSRIASIREVLHETKIKFHVTRSTILKDSHKISRLELQCSLVDCLEGKHRSFYTQTFAR